MDHEEREAAIIKRVYGSPYAHAENVLHRLRELERKMPTEVAIEVLFIEVVIGAE